MPPRQDDDVDWPPVDRGPRSRFGVSRPLPLIAGFVLAIAATLAVFLTDNAQYLRVAVVAVAWAFVLATFAAGRRQADRVMAAAREAELRRAYEVELDREVAARREYELEIENEIRRETEQSMRAELDALRTDIAALGTLRDDLAALGGLREEVARVAALRDDVAALTALRGELGQLGELRADMGRLRTELVERLASEMHVERITMRTQASRLPAEPGRDGVRTLDATPAWADGTPPRELTGGWPAVPLDEPRETRHPEPVRPRETTAAAWEALPPTSAAPPTPAALPTTAWPASPPAWSAEPAPATAGYPPAPQPQPRPEPRPEPYPTEEPWSYRTEGPRWSSAAHPAEPERAESDHRPTPWPSRPSAEQAAPPTETQQPIEWLAARSLLDARPPAPEPPAAPPTAAYGAAQPANPSAPPAGRPGGTTGSLRVSEILAENGMSPATGGRRRRRYRDEDTADDVLSRVLGRN